MDRYIEEFDEVLRVRRDKRFRDVFIQKEPHHALGPRRNASLFRGHPGFSPRREDSREVTRAESREILCNFLLSNSLRKKRYDLLKGYASAAKKRFSSHYIVIRSNALSAPAEC